MVPPGSSAWSVSRSPDSAGETPRETYEDGYKVNVILDAGYQSMHNKKWVRVKY